MRHLVLGTLIGEGATCRVHRARFSRRALRRQALKQKNNADDRRALQEGAQRLRNLAHANIIQHRVSIFTEYVALLVLPCCAADLAADMQQMAFAADARACGRRRRCHPIPSIQGLNHLVVKPANVLRLETSQAAGLCGSQGTYVLADFETCAQHGIRVNKKPGTAAYWPPEAFSASGFDGHLADMGPRHHAVGGECEAKSLLWCRAIARQLRR